ncbi:MAG: PEP-CTERM sorting domain-containing protein [Phycisphaerae bacterium]
MNTTRLQQVAVLLICLTLTPFLSADWNTFVIRDGTTTSPTIQDNSEYGVAAKEFVIFESGQKAGWGSDDINGIAISNITQLTITRHDDTTRFSSGSGSAVAPYFNIWVTDGAGHYAVVANEPSNPDFQPLFQENPDGSITYDLSYHDLADKRAKVYETPGWNDGTSWVHTLCGSDPLTFADVADLEIAAPPASYIQDPANEVGSGAPDELGTDTAYGVTWVFGDTLSNYVSGDEGYVVSGPSAIPEPATMALLGLGGLGVLTRRRRA